MADLATSSFPALGTTAVVVVVPPVPALACPPNPIAAITEKTADRMRDPATANRVNRETDCMPFSRARPTRGAPRPSDLIRVMRRSLRFGGWSSLGISFEIHLKRAISQVAAFA